MCALESGVFQFGQIVLIVQVLIAQSLLCGACGTGIAQGLMCSCLFGGQHVTLS